VIEQTIWTNNKCFFVMYEHKKWSKNVCHFSAVFEKLCFMHVILAAEILCGYFCVWPPIFLPVGNTLLYSSLESFYKAVINSIRVPNYSFWMLKLYSTHDLICKCCNKTRKKVRRPFGYLTHEWWQRTCFYPNKGCVELTSCSNSVDVS
jgi:hypothetical protein